MLQWTAQSFYKSEIFVGDNINNLTALHSEDKQLYIHF